MQNVLDRQCIRTAEGFRRLFIHTLWHQSSKCRLWLELQAVPALPGILSQPLCIIGGRHSSTEAVLLARSNNS